MYFFKKSRTISHSNFKHFLVYCLLVFCGSFMLNSFTYVYGQTTNLALNKTAAQSSVREDQKDRTPDKAVDADPNSMAETKFYEPAPWWQVNLGNRYQLNSIKMDLIAPDQLGYNYRVICSDIPFPETPLEQAVSALEKVVVKVYEIPGKNQISHSVTFDPPVTAQYLRIQRLGPKQGFIPPIGFKNIEILGNSTPSTAPKPIKSSWPVNIALNKQAQQSTTRELNGNVRVAGKAVDDDMESMSETDVIQGKQLPYPWWQVDLGNRYEMSSITMKIIALDQLMNDYQIIFSDTPFPSEPLTQGVAALEKFAVKAKRVKGSSNFEHKIELDVPVVAQYVRVQIIGNGYNLPPIGFKNLEIIGLPNPSTAPIPSKSSWDGLLSMGMPFDVQKDNTAYPEIIPYATNATSFDVAWKNQNGNDIIVTSYEKSGNNYVLKANGKKSYTNLGNLGGFTKDEQGNIYILTGEKPGANRDDCKTLQVFKNDKILYTAKKDLSEKNQDCKDQQKVRSPFYHGSARLAFGKGKVFLDTNLGPAHAHDMILNSNTLDQKQFMPLTGAHNASNHLIFDGTDFIIGHNVDHEQGLTLAKVSSSLNFPQQKWWHHENQTSGSKGARSVYCHTNFGSNDLGTEFGAIQVGVNDGDGYLVLFASERDWSFKYKGCGRIGDAKGKHYPREGESGDPSFKGILSSPFDLAVVHVKKDFDSAPPNITDANGNESLACPKINDNSSIVNSIGTDKAIVFDSFTDAWPWGIYNIGCAVGIEDGSNRYRFLKKHGVVWLTNYGEDYEGIPYKERTDWVDVTSEAELASKWIDRPSDSEINLYEECGVNDPCIGWYKKGHKPKFPSKNDKYTKVTRPKLVRVRQNIYIAIWEEWEVEVGVREEYLSTKAMKITLSKSGDKVNVSTGTIKELSNKSATTPLRLHRWDDAFLLDGKAAWVTGDKVNLKLKLHTVDENLNAQTNDLDL